MYEDKLTENHYIKQFEEVAILERPNNNTENKTYYIDG